MLIWLVEALAGKYSFTVPVCWLAVAHGSMVKLLQRPEAARSSRTRRVILLPCEEPEPESQCGNRSPK